MTDVTYKLDVDGVDWTEMKETLEADHFHNERTVAQLQASFVHSYAVCVAYAEGRIIGTVRALSDGVCNAYIVDVWTLSAYRRQGIASEMMRQVLAQLSGQHVYLFTDDRIDFYERLGFQRQDAGMGRVVGKWLDSQSTL